LEGLLINLELFGVIWSEFGGVTFWSFGVILELFGVIWREFGGLFKLYIFLIFSILISSSSGEHIFLRFR